MNNNNNNNNNNNGTVISDLFPAVITSFSIGDYYFKT
jgi:hypothetical protein